MKKKANILREEKIKFFGNRAWVSYISPYTILVPDGEEPLKVELKEINYNTYNHGNLCRIVDTMRIDGQELDAIICYDGAIALPIYGKYTQKESAVNYFNNLFCHLLLGGFYCEGIDTRDVVSGSLHEKIQIWPVDFGDSASSHLHGKLRNRTASNIDTIILTNPKHIFLSDFHKAIKQGKHVFDTIPNLSPTFLIKGVTEISYENWDLVLSNLWITAEQIIDHIWNKVFLSNKELHPSTEIFGRIKSLKSDTRTWSISVRLELLYQSGLISENVISNITPARKARNMLVHQGQNVTKQVAIDLFNVICELINRVTGVSKIKKIPKDKQKSGRTIKMNTDEDMFADWRSISSKNHTDH